MEKNGLFVPHQTSKRTVLLRSPLAPHHCMYAPTHTHIHSEYLLIHTHCHPRLCCSACLVLPDFFAQPSCPTPLPVHPPLTHLQVRRLVRTLLPPPQQTVVCATGWVWMRPWCRAPAWHLDHSLARSWRLWRENTRACWRLCGSCWEDQVGWGSQRYRRGRGMGGRWGPGCCTCNSRKEFGRE